LYNHQSARGVAREPTGKFLAYQRSLYINNKKQRVILALSEAFLLQCLSKKNSTKCRQNLNSLWRDHIQRWLAT
jgi:hypothetical protein